MIKTISGILTIILYEKYLNAQRKYFKALEEKKKEKYKRLKEKKRKSYERYRKIANIYWNHNGKVSFDKYLPF